ncbi:MAG: hypothetical protein K6E28_04885 [Eubacterium sp.]|nr:hypothetical protein [Eubacterium sp.]
MGEFRRLLTRNLIMMMIPPVIILMAVFFVSFSMMQQSDNLVYEFKDSSDVELYYKSGYQNVQMAPGKLQNSGFEVKSKDKVTGVYYYRLRNGRMEFFLLSDKTAMEISSGKASGKKRFTVIKDAATAEYIIGKYAESLGLPNKSIDGIESEYIFSEPDFPYIRIITLHLVYRISLGLLGVIILYTIIAAFFPKLNFETRDLSHFGKTTEVINDIDEEMTEMVLYKWDNIYITENYYLAVYVSHIDVIKLDEIRYLTKHRETVTRFPGRKETVYRLTASNVNKMYYEIDFPNEDVIDRVVSFIRGDE